MKRLPQVLSALLCTAVGCVPGAGHHCCGAELDDVRAALALASAAPAKACPVQGAGCPCGCETTGVCLCAFTDKPKLEGVAANYDDAVKSAAGYGCPLVAFVNQPARTVPGAIAYSVANSKDTLPRVWVGTSAGGTWLAGDVATDAIAWAARPKVTYQMPSFGGGCAGGRCH